MSEEKDHIHRYEGTHGEWICHCGDKQEHVAYFQTMAAYESGRRLEKSKNMLLCQLNASHYAAMVDGLKMALNICDDLGRIKDVRRELRILIAKVERKGATR